MTNPILQTLVVLALFGGLAAGFWAAVRRFGPSDFSFWHALGVMFTAKIVSRPVFNALPNLGLFERIGLMMAVYVTIMACDLNLIAKIKFGRALTIAICYALVATAMVTIVTVTGLLPSSKPLSSAQPPPGERNSTSP